MTKTELQKELLEKVKPGTKPSDIKKQQVKNTKDEGYQSEEEEKIVPINQKVKELENQIKSLNKQLQLYKDFRESDLKIKEKYKQEISDLKKQNQDLDYLLKTGKNSDIIKKLQQENKNLNKTIEDLQKQAKSKGSEKEPINKTFFCDACQLTKQGTYIKRKVDAPFEPRLHKRVCYLCSDCSPYVKELSEPDFDPDNNPYRIN